MIHSIPHLWVMKNGLKNMRKRAGLTQDRLAEIVDMSQVHLANLEDGRKTLNLKRVQQFSKVLGCSEADVWGYTVPQNTVPIIAQVTATLFLQTVFSEEFLEGEFERVTIDGDSKGKFAIQMPDNSMSAVIPEGAFVVIDTYSKKALDGHVYLFCTSDRSRLVIRSFNYESRSMEPQSISNEYQSMQFSSNEADWRIIGQVVSMHKVL